MRSMIIQSTGKMILHFLLLKIFFRYLTVNREIGCALIGPYGDIGFIHKMEDLLEENSREVLLQMFPEKSGEMNYFYSYCLNGMSWSCQDMA